MMPGDSIIAISASGLEFQHRKLETIANNISNMNVAGSKSGAVYKPLEVISYSNVEIGTGIDSGQLRGVTEYEVVERAVEAKNIYDPSHPEADGAGYVKYPAVDHVSEMTNLIAATRAYEANLKAMQAARAMAIKALEIGNK